VMWNTTATAIDGDNVVKRLRFENVKTGETGELDVDGVFFYVGNDPVTDFIEFGLEKDEKGYIKTDEAMRTSVPGVFAAGDVRAKTLRQIATAVGDGAVAVHSAGQYLTRHGKA
jgi:thioredoxin reductase (NADPH)